MLKTVDLKSLCIGVLIMMVAVVFMLLATSNPAPTQWEYKTLLIGGYSDDATLDGLGKNGWEIVGFSYAPGGRNENAYARYVLKRAKVYAKKPRWKFW